MVRFINKFTGTVMWVAEDRAEEYKSAGHKPADESSSSVPQETLKQPAVKEKKPATVESSATPKKTGKKAK